jgi:hypothetical protein
MKKLLVIDRAATAGPRIHPFPFQGGTLAVTFPDAATPVSVPAEIVERFRLAENPAFEVVGEAPEPDGNPAQGGPGQAEIIAALQGDLAAAGERIAELEARLSAAAATAGGAAPPAGHVVANLAELSRPALMARVGALPDKGGIANPMTAKTEDLIKALLDAARPVA